MTALLACLLALGVMPPIGHRLSHLHPCRFLLSGSALERNPDESDAQVDGLHNATATEMTEEKELEDSFVNITAIDVTEEKRIEDTQW
jgi:hypothetical protein